MFDNLISDGQPYIAHGRRDLLWSWAFLLETQMADVRITEEARSQLENLPKGIHARVHKLLERLTSWPNVSGAKPLRGELAGHWRLRTGDYRLQFHLEDDTVVVERIGHRDGFYES